MRKNQWSENKSNKEICFIELLRKYAPIRFGGLSGTRIDLWFLVHFPIDLKLRGIAFASKSIGNGILF